MSDLRTTAGELTAKRNRGKMSAVEAIKTLRNFKSSEIGTAINQNDNAATQQPRSPDKSRQNT